MTNYMNKILPRVSDNQNWLKIYAELALTKKCKSQGIKSLWDNILDETGSMYIALVDLGDEKLGKIGGRCEANTEQTFCEMQLAA